MYQETKNLLAYKKSHELVLEIYKMTNSFPSEEKFGLSSQIRRAAASIPSNISEGRGRGTPKEYQRFLQIARGSLEEVKYQILLSKDLNYITEDSYNLLDKQTNEVGRLINGIINKLSCI